MPYWQGNYVLTMTHKNYLGWLLVLHFLFSFIWTFVIHLGCWMPNTSNPKSILHTNALGLSFFTFNIFFFVFLIVPPLSRNWDNQLILSRLSFINCYHLHLFDIILGVDWMNKMMRLEVGMQGDMWGFDHFECIFNSQINF